MNAQRLKVMEPKFYHDFQCLGNDCPDLCCRSWTVPVDKKSYKQLKKHKDTIVRQFVGDSLKLVKNSDTEWAHIRMSTDGRCSALDDKGLCEIHKRCGHSALPDTCQEYPRRANTFGEQVEMSLFLSCPAAVDNILFDPSAMVFEEYSKNTKNVMNGKLSDMSGYVPDWLPMIRDLSFSLLLDPDASFEEKMFCLGYFLTKAQTVQNDTNALAQLIEEFSNQYNNGELHTLFNGLPAVDKLKWHTFATQDAVLFKSINHVTDNKGNTVVSSTGENIQAVRQELLSLMNKMVEQELKTGKEEDQAQLDAFSNLLRAADEKYLSAFYHQNPQFLTNYGLYFIYHEQFMHHKGLSLFDFFKVMTINTLLFKVYLSAFAINHEGLDKQDVIKIYNCVNRVTQHNPNYVENVLAALKNADGVAQILGLFK